MTYSTTNTHSRYEYRAGIDKLRADGLIDMHDSGAFFRFTDKGAQRFA
jgi:hypothetical protein